MDVLAQNIIGGILTAIGVVLVAAELSRRGLSRRSPVAWLCFLAGIVFMSQDILTAVLLCLGLSALFLALYVFYQKSRAGINYQTVSRSYGILDKAFFQDNGRNPRDAVVRMARGADSVLDLCAGTAENSFRIAQSLPDATVVGIDLSPDMLAVARRGAKERGLSNLRLARMDATHTGFEDAAFDMVLVSLVLHEVSDGVARAMLREARRVLRPGGRIIVMEWETPRRFSQKLRFLLIRAAEPAGFNRFLKQDMREYFEARGFVIEAEQHCDYSRVFTLCPADGE